MIQKFIVIALVALIVSCGRNSKITDKNSRQVEIDFADISISLPKVFHRFSPDELIYSIEDLDSAEMSETEKLARIDQIETVKSTNLKFYIYVDTTNINNTIIFLAEDYLKLDNEVRQYILSNADKSLKPKIAEQGVQIKRVDNQFFKGRRVEILKLKYEVMRQELSSYWTTYMVTTVSNSFQIFVTRIDIEDYEDRVTRMGIGL